MGLGLIRSGPDALLGSIEATASLTSCEEIILFDREQLAMLFIFGRLWFESSNVDWEKKKSFRTFAFSSLLVMCWLLSNTVGMVDDDFLFVSCFAKLNHSFAETLLELILSVSFLLYSCFDFRIFCYFVSRLSEFWPGILCSDVWPFCVVFVSFLSVFLLCCSSMVYR